MTEVGADDSLRCVVFRGDGDKAFAAGADIAEFHSERANSTQAKAYSEEGINWMRGIAECRHPTVALIQGACVGGGLLIASQCDLRICNASARFGVPVKNLGLVEAYDELEGMMRVVGRAASLELLLEGRIWNAREAYEKAASGFDACITLGATGAAPMALAHRLNLQGTRQLAIPAELTNSAGRRCRKKGTGATTTPLDSVSGSRAAGSGPSSATRSRARRSAWSG